jgi:CHAT domain-containing protein
MGCRQFKIINAKLRAEMMVTTGRQRLVSGVLVGAIAISLGSTPSGRADPPPALDRFPQEATVLDEPASEIALGQELAALQRIPLAELTSAQRQRLLELDQIQRELYREFRAFIESPEIRALQAELQISDQHLELDDLTRLSNDLAQLESPAVLYYPLILEDRLELLIVTAHTPPLRRTVAVSQIDLNRAIADFRQALETPNSDPRPQAQQLYQWLIQPIEADLAQAGTETILFAPDGALRYVPLAALHDGDRWLAERFVTSQITAASLTDFSAAPAPQWRILAAAWSEGSHTIQVGDVTLNLSPIPGAVAEVGAIAALFPDTTVLQGAEFTPEAVQRLARDHNVLHLATHTALAPGDPTNSFVAFGNGDVLTLRDFRDWSLPGVELVVLSGGETALGGSSLGDGTEVLGLGYTLQRAGAKAVLASLWNVSDFGTQALMEAFYGGLSQGLTVAESLQQAQVSLITAPPAAIRQYQKAGATPTLQPAREDVFPGYSHPYYWAPFILIGNGL